MQIRLRGEMSMAQVRQALFEKLHEIEDEYAVRFSRGATLFINPSDEFGNDVVPRRRSGEEITTLVCNGPYQCAADERKL